MTAIRSIRPHFSIEDAIGIARDTYGLTGLARELPSERDQNFYFRSDSGEEFTLKIANTDESRSVLDMQYKAMERIRSEVPFAACPRVCPTTDGEKSATTIGADGSKHFVRLVTFLPGVPLGEFRPHSPELLHKIGALLGAIDKSLASFSHEAAGRELYWDLRNAGRIINSYKHLIENSTRWEIVERFLSEWERNVVPVLPSLGTSVIHHDANDYNLIVDGETAGIIDFGDMLRTYRLSEVAIAAAYVMLDKPDPLSAAAHVVGGYHEVFPLNETELEVLFNFICMRLCVSDTIAAHQKQLEPENEYLRISEGPAWALLARLCEINPRLAQYTFRSACGFEPCPKSSAVVSWLKRNAGGFASILDADLTQSDALVLDLSVGSLELGTRNDATDIETFTTRTLERIREAGAKVAVGRYNEARGVYTGELFQGEGNDGPDSRTIHIGIDLFKEAGSPIYAPLDGFVHSFKNNAALLDYGPTIILRHPIGDADEFFTLYGHLSLDSLDGLSAGMPMRRGDRIAKIGTYPQNGGWSPHVHFQIIADMFDREGEFPGVASPSQRAVWLSLSPDPNLILGIPSERFPKPAPACEETLEQRRQYIGPSLSLSYKHPLKIVRGYGQFLYDEDGRRYLDCVNNVAHVGHCHPKVVRAAERQMAVLNTNTRYLHDNIVEYARRLCEKLPEPLSVCFFVNSGSEANDLAMRLARAHTKATGVVVLEGAYHGNLTSLIEISPYKFNGPGGTGAPAHVHKMPIGMPVEVPECRPIAAFIAESILSCAGQVVLPPGYLAEAYRNVRAAGAVCIADEVQVGFGRVGSHFWGFETQGVLPDVVTMGKPIGNGHPLGAVVTTREIAQSFNNGMEYFNTYGGNPVSCAVGLAVLDVIEEEKLQANALRVGAYLKVGLERLRQKYPLTGDVRGLGLFLGIEFVLDRKTRAPATGEASYIVERMKNRGILLSTDGAFHNVIKIKPPLVFTKSDADSLIGSLDRVLGETRISQACL